MGLPNLATLHTMEFLGFYWPPLMFWAFAAFVLFAVVRRLLERSGLYRFVWHRPLFNLALYVLFVGGIAFFGTFAWP